MPLQIKKDLGKKHSLRITIRLTAKGLVVDGKVSKKRK